MIHYTKPSQTEGWSEILNTKFHKLYNYIMLNANVNNINNVELKMGLLQIHETLQIQ